LANRTDNPSLNFIIDLVNARQVTKQPFRQGGLLDQPYFMLTFVEPWVQQGYAERQKIPSNDLVFKGAQ